MAPLPHQEVLPSQASWTSGKSGGEAGHILSIPLQEPCFQLINQDCLPVQATLPSSTIWSPRTDVKSHFFPGCSTPVPDNIKPLPSPKGSFKIKAAKGRRRLCPQTSLWCPGTAGTEPCASGEVAQLQAWHCYWNPLLFPSTELGTVPMACHGTGCVTT